ncbi:MAG: hypothetical protein ACI8P2_005018 [Candidatus Latescibacterota bacterium]|jgi:hypothetical protein
MKNSFITIATDSLCGMTAVFWEYMLLGGL